MSNFANFIKIHLIHQYGNTGIDKVSYWWVKIILSVNVSVYSLLLCFVSFFSVNNLECFQVLILTIYVLNWLYWNIHPFNA